jgi:hypothetical protein
MGDLSYERRINLLKVPDNIKDKAIEKLKSMKGNFQGDNKAQSWLDGFLKIPFGVYRENSLINYKKNQIKSLGNNLYSCNEIKNFIESIIAEEESVLDNVSYLINYKTSNTLSSKLESHNLLEFLTRLIDHTQCTPEKLLNKENLEKVAALKKDGD